jgi:hypothetical protein
MWFVALISGIFIFLVGIQILFWCQILTGFVMHLRLRQSLSMFTPLIKDINPDEEFKGYE